MHSDRVKRPAFHRLAWLLPSWALFTLAIFAPLAAQQQDAADEADEAVAEQDTFDATDATTDSLVGAAVSVGDDIASLELALSDGRTVQLELRNDIVYADGERIGTFEEGDQLDDSWRRLLEEAAMASTDELPALLRQWQAPEAAGVAGDRLAERLEQALAGVGGRMSVASSATPAEDSIDRLLARVHELESHREHQRASRDDGWGIPAFLEDFLDGLGGMFATLVWFGVFFGIGSALVFFGDGRIERVADTIRTEPLRASLIGLAGAFLSMPFYVLVMLALAISILGIPLILAWAPLFPMLVALSFITGWIAVAYGAGDSLVKRKLSGRGMFRQAGSFHSLGVGIALLLIPFALGSLFKMTGVFDWLGALLFVLGIIANILVAAIGFGAVLIRGRAGLDRHRERRAAEKRALGERSTLAQENTNV